MLWELQEDIGGKSDKVRGLTLSGKAAVFVGNARVRQEGGDETYLVIQAVDRTTGEILWSDQTFLSCCTIEPLYVASHQGRVYVLGTLRPGDARSAFLVRAYDVSSGTLLWENVWNPDEGTDSDHPTAITATQSQVVVVGYGVPASRNKVDALVRAFDPLTGTVLWENRDSRDSVEVIAWEVVANRNRVFVAGTTSPVSHPVNRDLFVRAYDAQSGDVRWETSRQLVFPSKLKLASGRLLVAGRSQDTTYLAALSTKNGAMVWEDTLPAPGSLAEIAVRGSRIAGAVIPFALRAYDVATGSIEWEDRPTTPPGFFQFISAVELNDNVAYAVGTAGQEFGNSELMVRAYDAGTGTLLWDDRSHSSLESNAVDVVLGKSRLFVAGTTLDPSTSTDFLIRVYEVPTRR